MAPAADNLAIRMKTLLIRGTEGIEDVVGDAVASVRANPARREIEQKRVIAAYRRACPTVSTDETFSVLVGLYPELFCDDEGVLVRGSRQRDAVKPRIINMPGASDEENEAELKRYLLQQDFIANYKAKNPDTSINKMFEDLGAQYPSVFNDKNLYPLQDSI